MAPNTYPFSKSDKFTVTAKPSSMWRIFGLVISFACLSTSGLFGWLFVFPEKPLSTGAIVIILLTAIVTFLFGIYVIATLFKSSLEVNHREIRVYKALKVQRIAINEVESFCKRQGSNCDEVWLIGSDAFLDIELIFEHKQAFLNWLAERFEDLDATERQQAMEQIKNDAELGVDSEQRVIAVESGEKTVKYLAILCFALFFWALIYPHPYELVVGLLLFVALLTFVLPHISGIKVKWDSSKNDPFGKTFYLIVPATGGLDLRAMHDWSILSWSDFWLPFTIALVFLLILYLISYKEEKLFSATTLISILIFSGLSTGAILTLNGVLPQSSASKYQTIITDKAKARYVTLAPWLHQSEAIKAEVGNKTHDQAKVGDVVDIKVYPGAFGIPYYTWHLSDKNPI